jgi:hypothetical protein
MAIKVLCCVKWYQAVRIAEEEEILRRRITRLHYVCIAYLVNFDFRFRVLALLQQKVYIINYRIVILVTNMGSCLTSSKVKWSL